MTQSRVFEVVSFVCVCCRKPAQLEMDEDFLAMVGGRDRLMCDPCFNDASKRLMGLARTLLLIE